MGAIQFCHALDGVVFIFFYNKESVKFPTHYLLFSKQIVVLEASKSAVSMFYTLMNQVRISQINKVSESLLEWFKWSDWLNKTKAVKNECQTIKVYNHQSAQSVLVHKLK